MLEITGHRGARDLYPENTLGGFRLAGEIGCNRVELDVRLTADNRLAVIHDATIDRTTNGTGSVSDFTVAELKDFDAGNGEPVPLLDEVFDLLEDLDMTIQVELKGAGTEELAPLLAGHRGVVDRVVFTSSHHRRVLRAKQLLPEVRTGVLIACNPVDPIGLLSATEADNLHVKHQALDSHLIDQVRDGGYGIVAWGRIVEQPVIDHVLKLGPDVIGSDRPDLVIDRAKQLGLV